MTKFKEKIKPQNTNKKIFLVGGKSIVKDFPICSERLTKIASTFFCIFVMLSNKNLKLLVHEF